MTAVPVVPDTKKHTVLQPQQRTVPNDQKCCVGAAKEVPGVQAETNSLEGRLEAALTGQNPSALLSGGKAIRVETIFDHFEYYPDAQRSLLGRGGRGEVFAMTPIRQPKREGETDTHSSTVPTVRAVKVISKRQILRHDRSLEAFLSEFKLVSRLSHDNICSAAGGVYHNDTTVFIALEKFNPVQDTVRTRLYRLFAKYAPERISQVESLVERWEKEYYCTYCSQRCQQREEKTCSDFAPGHSDKLSELPPSSVERIQAETFYDAQLAIIAAQLGSRQKLFADGNCTDLYSAIRAGKTIPEEKALLIIKQCLQGLEFMHHHQVIHRDIKTENVILGETRTSEPIRDENGAVVGVRLKEKIQVKLIDFGLARQLTPAVTTQAPAVDNFIHSRPTLYPIPSLMVESPDSGACTAATDVGHSLQSNDEANDLTESFSSVHSSSETSSASSYAQHVGVSDSFSCASTTLYPTSSSERSTTSTAIAATPPFLTRVPTPAGTPTYLAPEIIEQVVKNRQLKATAAPGSDPISQFANHDTLQKIDVWGAGVMLYAMVVGRPPFPWCHGSVNANRLKDLDVSQLSFPDTVSDRVRTLIKAMLRRCDPPAQKANQKEAELWMANEEPERDEEGAVRVSATEALQRIQKLFPEMYQSPDEQEKKEENEAEYSNEEEEKGEKANSFLLSTTRSTEKKKKKKKSRETVEYLIFADGKQRCVLWL